MERRPFKIWTADRKKKKSIVVSSFQELQERGTSVLEFSASDNLSKIVLEEDGTEVDDEEYFQFLDNNSTFLLLKAGEEWAAADENVVQDQVDGELDVADSFQEDQFSCLWKSTAKSLRGDISRIVTLNEEQLEALTSVDQQQLSNAIRCSVRDAAAIQMTCQRYLDERADTQDAKALLTVLSRLRDSQGHSTVSSDILSKRPRIN